MAVTMQFKSELYDEIDSEAEKAQIRIEADLEACGVDLDNL